MTAQPVLRILLTAGSFLLALSGSVGAAPETIAPELEARAQANLFGDYVPVIITFNKPIDQNQFARHAHKQQRRYELLTKLKARAVDPARQALRASLESRGIRDVRNLWINNSIAANVPAGLLAELAHWPGIVRIRLDAVLQAPTTTYTATSQAGWNIRAVHAPEAWGLGYTGQGVVVAIFDTGVDATHPDLSGQYRGGTNSWFDPYGEHATPYDVAGHGTSVAGIVVGRNASGSVIGMAPDARWIAARAFDDNGNATLSAMHQAFQWLLDPDRNPATDDAPDVVNASWGLINVSGGCSTEFQPDIQALKVAGIAIVFSAGNDGPAPSTSVSPGNNPDIMSVGALDSSLSVTNFSARGPSDCNAAIDPELAAPGAEIFTADTSHGLGTGTYAVMQGTSFAAPHVTGAMAVLLSANPELTVTELESLLQQTAVDLGAAGVDNDYGNGLLDVTAAISRANGNAPSAQRDTAVTDEDTPVTINVLANDSDAQARPLSVTAVASPSQRGGVVVLNADKTVTYTPAPNFPAGTVPVTDSFTYRLSNGVGVSTGTVTVSVTPVNDVPLAQDDRFSISADSNGQLRVAAPGVLANDSDVDGDALSAQLVTNVTTGTVSLQANGAFQYTPPPGGVPGDSLSFTYRVSDGRLLSNIATVRFTFNRKPEARDDDVRLAPPDANHVYTLANPGVLGNDSDPDGDALSAILVSNVQSGSVTLDTQGGFRYTAPASGVPGGTLRFTYQVSDGQLQSNIATVSFIANQAPVAGDDVVALSAASAAGPYQLPAPGILGNDRDADGDTLSPSLSSGVASGNLDLRADGSLSYTPPATGFAGGTVGFSYRVSDGKTSSNIATVRATLNLLPVGVEDKDIVIQPDTQGLYRYSGNLLANDRDPDGDPLTASLLTNVGTGSVTLTPGGGFLYTPPAGSVPLQQLSFLYSPHDGKSPGDPAVVSFRLEPSVVTPVYNDYVPAPIYTPVVTPVTPSSTLTDVGSSTPTVASEQAPLAVNSVRADSERKGLLDSEPARLKSREEPSPVLQPQDDQFTLSEPDEHGHYPLPAPGVLANDSGEGQLSALLVRNVRLGKILLNADGGFSYVPPRGGAPNTPVTFSYRVRDGKGYSREASVTLQIESGLEAKADEFVLRQRNSQGQYLLAAPGVLANDVRAKAAQPVLVQNVMVGAVKLNADGGFVYVPPADGSIPRTPQNFVYRLSAGKDYSRVASVTFVLGQELAARPDTLVLRNVDSAGRFILPAPGVLANDGGNGTLSAILTEDVSRGKLILNADGGLSYVPPSKDKSAAALSFRYRVSDGKNVSQETSVTLVLSPAPAPRAASAARPTCLRREDSKQCDPALARTAELATRGRAALSTQSP